MMGFELDRTASNSNELERTRTNSNELEHDKKRTKDYEIWGMVEVDRTLTPDFVFDGTCE